MLKMIDELVSDGTIEEPVVAQIGYTDYKTDNYKCLSIIPEQEFQKYVAEASVIITHSGSGALFSSIKQGKKIIAVARLKKYNEMVDDHQTELVKKLTSEGYIIDGTASLREAWNQLDSFTPRKYDFLNTIVEVISNWIDNDLI
jgi:UDP-N-acetylglucosamine transferase subunit ALG13